MRRFELGSSVEDVITGFKGTVTAHCVYITGCEQYLVAPKIDKSGAIRDSVWFDEDRLVVTRPALVSLARRSKATGFDKPAPKR